MAIKKTVKKKMSVEEVKKLVKNENQRVTKANADFAKLSPSEKRIAIARDVLAQLDAKHLIATSGVWLQSSCNIEKLLEDNEKLEMQTVLNSVKQCDGCALGGMFLSAVSKADKLKVSELNDSSFNGHEIDINESDVFKYMRRFFSKEQLNLIEFVFEQGDGARNIAIENVDLAYNFFDGKNLGFDKIDPEAETRMRLIMENIIANNGTFSLKKKPVLVWKTPGFLG